MLGLTAVNSHCIMWWMHTALIVHLNLAGEGGIFISPYGHTSIHINHFSGVLAALNMLVGVE